MKDYFPIGVGFGKYGTWYAAINYSEYYIKYNMNTIYGLTRENSKYSTDTFWPAIIGETGIIGLGIYIALIIYTFKSVFYAYKNSINEKGEMYIIRSIALLIFIIAIIESFGEASFNASPKNIITALFVGFSLNSKQIKKVGG